MRRYTRYSYVQARLQARHGQRPTESEWKRLTAIGSLPQFLQAARNGPLRRWVFELGAHSSVHDMELTLRRHFRDHVLEVAAWMPPEWRAAVAWTRHVPELPALAHLLRGEPAPRWAREDPKLKVIAGEAFDDRRRELEQTDMAPLLRAAADEPFTAIVHAWTRHWRSLWPETDPATAGHLQQLAKAVGQARVALGSSHSVRSEPPLEALEQRLITLFRRHTHESTAAFTHLALTMVMLERLRGELAVRMLFPPPSEEVA